MLHLNHEKFNKRYGIYLRKHGTIIIILIEEFGAKTAQVMIFGDFLKCWEILSLFHRYTVF